MLLVMAPYVIPLVKVNNLKSERLMNYFCCGWQRQKATYLITDCSFSEGQFMV